MLQQQQQQFQQLQFQQQSHDFRALLQQLRRSTSVGIGCAADILTNYPLWIAAKRMGVGIPAMPATIPQLYKGGGSFWVSLGPTTMLEDASKKVLEDHLPSQGLLQGFGIENELMASALAGAFAAVTFCSQVEHAITVAHAKELTMSGAVRHIFHKRGGLHGLLLPPGMLAMVFREMPFVAALFYIQPAVKSGIYGMTSAGSEPKPDARLHLELASGFATSIVTTPLSHVPSVVAAYQQGHGVSLQKACFDMYSQGGWRAFWRGLVARTVSIAGTMTVVPLVIGGLAAK